MAERIAKIVESHTRIADASEVADNARKMYDRTARLLADKAAGINSLMRKLDAAQNNKQEDVPVDDVKNILYSGKLARPDEEFCRYILCALIKGEPKQDPLSLTTADIRLCPELVSTLPEPSLPQGSPKSGQ